MTDGAALEAFYAEIRARLVRFIRARLPADVADDLASETLLTLWGKRPAAPVDDVSVRRLRAFTYAIAIGHVRNAERRLATDGKLVGALAAAALRDSAISHDPARSAVGLYDLERAIRALSNGDQQVLRLLAAGFRVGEIAPKAASMRVRRARERLRERLAATGTDGAS
ncbi:hypothetical protein [Nocardioides caricicola]|uniref:RNA polymerase sigma factor n=1 Tax=Nocardioides caricicola TaxID=634770 RepID=A0ABW0MXU9_9ACTN